MTKRENLGSEVRALLAAGATYSDVAKVLDIPEAAVRNLAAEKEKSTIDKAVDALIVMAVGCVGLHVGLFTAKSVITFARTLKSGGKILIFDSGFSKTVENAVATAANTTSIVATAMKKENRYL